MQWFRIKKNVDNISNVRREASKNFWNKRRDIWKLKLIA